MRSKMARYTMIASMRQGGGNSRGEMRGEGNYGRNEMRNEGGQMRGGMEMGYGGYGGYGEMNYEAENRFRDRRGREHYDNGRFAPMRGEMEEEMEMRRGNQGGARNEYRAENYGGMEYRGGEMRGGREGEMRRGGGRSEMRGGWDDEEEMRMNQIGFERPQEAQNHYPTRIDYMPRNEMERGSSPRMHGGAMGAGMEKGMDRETAEEWVAAMKNEDGTTGGRWKLEQVKALLSQKAMDREPYEVWAVMNAMYSDYGKALKKFNVTQPDAFLAMALAFIDDKDAVPNKARMYYECIVKH